MNAMVGKRDFRELDAHEIEMVSGGLDGYGDIVVTGSFDFGYYQSYSDLYYAQPTSDYVWPDIVVTAPLTHSQIEEAEAFARDQAEHNLYTAETVFGLPVGIEYQWSAGAIGIILGYPQVRDSFTDPAQNALIEAQIDGIFAGIVAFGGVNNYITYYPYLSQ